MEMAILKRQWLPASFFGLVIALAANPVCAKIASGWHEQYDAGKVCVTSYTDPRTRDRFSLEWKRGYKTIKGLVTTNLTAKPSYYSHGNISMTFNAKKGGELGTGGFIWHLWDKHDATITKLGIEFDIYKQVFQSLQTENTVIISLTSLHGASVDSDEWFGISLIDATNHISDLVFCMAGKNSSDSDEDIGEQE
jgi:hypothetical protein